jgi:hypothetical protein
LSFPNRNSLKGATLVHYMLNLVFNYSDGSALNGRFVDYSIALDPLLISKAWLRPTATAPDPPDPNCSGDWQLFSHDKQPLAFPVSEQPTLWVRVVDSNQVTDTFYTRITLLMGRNDQKNPPQGQMSSPIQNSNGVTGPLCIWDTAFVQASLTPRGGSNASWWAPLGPATLSFPNPAKINNYIFLVAATVLGNPAQGFPKRTFSHDPDMDVSC